MSNILLAQWQVPERVFACSTYRSLPLDKTIPEHRHHLVKSLNLPSEPAWLSQNHSAECIIVDNTEDRKADAAITRKPNQVLAVLTADCVPIVLTNTRGSEIAAIHAGWRGLCHGIIEATIKKMHTQPEELIAWIGPSICGRCYEVGKDVLDTFKQQYAFATDFFKPISNEKWLADLQGLAERILTLSSITAVYQSKACTFEQNELYYSYRRGEQTGRIATLIWFT